MTACQASQDHPLPLSRADLAFASSARVAGPLSRADLAFASSARVAIPLSRADLAFASSARVAVLLPSSPFRLAKFSARSSFSLPFHLLYLYHVKLYTTFTNKFLEINTFPKSTDNMMVEELNGSGFCRLPALSLFINVRYS